MAATKKIPLEQLAAYFDASTKRFLRDGSPEAVDVEVVAPELGEQLAVQGARLIGITYDRKAHSLELEIEPGDHRVFTPKEVWTIEEPNGFIRVVEIVRPDGTREIVNVNQVGLRRLDGKIL